MALIKSRIYLQLFLCINIKKTLLLSLRSYDDINHLLHVHVKILSFILFDPYTEVKIMEKSASVESN